MTENNIIKLPECQHIAKMPLMSDLFSCTLIGSILILVAFLYCFQTKRVCLSANRSLKLRMKWAN